MEVKKITDKERLDCLQSLIDDIKKRHGKDHITQFRFNMLSSIREQLDALIFND